MIAASDLSGDPVGCVRVSRWCYPPRWAAFRLLISRSECRSRQLIPPFEFFKVALPKPTTRPAPAGCLSIFWLSRSTADGGSDNARPGAVVRCTAAADSGGRDQSVRYRCCTVFRVINLAYDNDR